MKKLFKNKIFWFLLIAFVFVSLILIILFRTLPDKTSTGGLPQPPAIEKMSKPVAMQIQRALTEASKYPTDENLGQLGMIYHSNTYYTEAKECYLKAIEARPDQWKWNYYLGYLYSELGETENAIQYFKQAAALNPGDAYVSYYLGDAYLKQGNHEAAEKIFSDLAASDKTGFKPGEKGENNLYPLKVYARLSLARLLMNSSRLEAAEKTCQSLLADYPDYGPAYRLLANIYAQQGKEEPSSANTLRANELTQFIPFVDPRIAQLAMLSRSGEYILKQIDLAAFTGNQEWAKKLLDHAHAFMPDDQFVNSKSIQFYLLYGFGEDINKKIDYHYSAFSNDFNELAKLATQFNKNGKYGWALMYYERCNVLKPGDTTILHNLAVNYTNVGNSAKADSIIEVLLKAQPEDLKFLSDATTLYTKMGKKDKALHIIRNIENRNPDNPIINKLKAGVALNEDDYQLADNYYSKYLQKVPDDIDGLQYVGLRQVQNKSWSQAILHYRKALDYYPNNPVFLEKLGTLYFQCPDANLRNLDQARYYLDRTYFSIKSNTTTRVAAGKNLAAIYVKEKNWEKAIQIINTTRIMAANGKLPEEEVRLLNKTWEDYQILSMNKK